jgi:hypothetical protein
VVLPGVIEGEGDEAPPAEVTLRRLLASHPHAPSLLSEARHRLGVAKDSALAAVQALRSARDHELAYELARRKADPRDVRHFHFWLAAVCFGALLAVSGAAGLLLAWGVPWPDRIMFAIAAAILGGVVAWRLSLGHGRAGLGGGFVVAGLGLCVILMAIRAITAGGPLLLGIGEAIGLGLVLAGAVLAAVFVFWHSESWRCSRLRRISAQAIRQRQEMLTRASLDDSSAQAAMGAWESLVVEECQLAHPGQAASDAWLDDCVNAARRIATPTS